MSTAIKFENISKQYRLGLVSTRTLSHDLNRWWKMNIRGKEDPYLKIGEVNDRAHKGSSEYVWALRDINLDVQEGEVLGIIGKNGAGKSTLLKILSKITSPTTGSIKARGRIASLLEVGTGFHPELTGRENIYMNGAILGMTKPEIARKLDEIVDFAGIERYIDTPVKRYSSGMTVRLGFAVAAHLEPEILVVDEVLAVGDAEFQKKAIGKMQDISKGQGRTVLFVSHNMASVENLCTRSILLENGTISFDGESSFVINTYLDIKNKDLDIPIYARNDRSGNGILKIHEIILENNESEEIIRSFDKIKITISFNKKFACNNIRLILGFYEFSNNALFRIDTGLIQTNRNKNFDKIIIRTSEINLVPTNCFVNVALYIDENLSDYIVNAKRIEIYEKRIENIMLHKRNLATILLRTTTQLE